MIPPIFQRLPAFFLDEIHHIAFNVKTSCETQKFNIVVHSDKSQRL